jgi:hypothetical protein
VESEEEVEAVVDAAKSAKEKRMGRGSARSVGE